MSDREADEVLWDLLHGVLCTRALAIVADLGVPEALAAGPRHVDELARDLGIQTDSLYRILRALASEGVFAEEGRRLFRNTPASDLLRRDGWGDFAHLFGGVWHRAVGELDASGVPPFPQIFGTDFWSWLAAHPDERAAFDGAMVEGTVRRAERLAGLQWRGDETVVDVGGGNGALLLELLRRKPGLRGIVFDRPETVRDEASFDERCTFVAGDFFASVPAGDAYVLSTVLHDWDDERACAILETIRRSAPPEGRVLVLDSVVAAGNEPHSAKWLDLLMLTLFGGRERDEEEWRELLSRAGFEPVRLEDRLIEARCR
jgi:SAM-dependent methyltransferase